MSARGFSLALVALLAVCCRAAEVLPPSPAAYFNDYASLVSPSTAASLNQDLAQFERATSNQVLVAIFPKLETDSSVEDYCVRVAQSWRVGQQGKSNGAVLFVFAQSHKIYLEVGYGLEGALPDALAKRIVSDDIAPRFRKGDYDGGMAAGVSAIMAATRGEYKGTGKTVGDRDSGGMPIPFLFLIVVAVLIVASIRRRAFVYQSGGRSGFGRVGVPWIFPGGGGGFGGGGGGGSSGGGFSGGGGSFGGGGAGGSW